MGAIKKQKWFCSQASSEDGVQKKAIIAYKKKSYFVAVKWPKV